MKKLLFMFLTLFTGVFFISCIDSMQAVSYKNGQYVITSRFTMSKDMISTLVSLGDSDTSSLEYTDDLEDYVYSFGKLLGESMNSRSPKIKKEINELYKSLKDSNMFPASGCTSKVDTNADVGIHYEARVYANSYTAKDFTAYIPKKYKNALTLELSKNLTDSLSEELGEFAGILSGTKHRIYIAKSILPTLTNSEITNINYVGKSLTFYDVGEMWCIELPFSFLSEKGSASYKYIVMYF